MTTNKFRYEAQRTDTLIEGILGGLLLGAILYGLPWAIWILWGGE